MSEFMPPVPVAASRLLNRLRASQEQRLIEERTAKDYAIEFGRYLATAAEKFLMEQNRAAETGETPDPDYWSALSSAIYEFRKRADRTGVKNGG